MVVPGFGGEPRDLTTGQEASFDSIHWSPDGSSLLATANVDGGSGIALIDAASGKLMHEFSAEKVQYLYTYSIDCKMHVMSWPYYYLLIRVC